MQANAAPAIEAPERVRFVPHGRHVKVLRQGKLRIARQSPRAPRRSPALLLPLRRERQRIALVAAQLRGLGRLRLGHFLGVDRDGICACKCGLVYGEAEHRDTVLSKA